MICSYEKYRGYATMDTRYTCYEEYMVLMHGRMPYKTGMLAIGPCRFIRYTNNSGLVAGVEDKTGTVCNVSSTHLLSCLSTPKQVQIDELPIDFINGNLEELADNKALLPDASY